MMRICFVGLGTMGLPMASRLVGEGFDLSGWDALPEARERFSNSADTLPAAVTEADVLLTMLPEGADVEATYEIVLGLALPERVLFVDCSTIDIETTRNLARRVRAAGHGFIDAPVSGGAEGARAGTLSFMVGGAAEDIERGRPVLAAMGSRITAFGEAGTGQAAKACHNMICGITALAVCEAFALAQSLELDADKFFTLCQGAAAQSWILENRCPVPGVAPAAPSSNAYAPGFAARLMAKDLRLAQAAASLSGQEIPFGAAAAERFSAFVASGDGNLDFSAIFQQIRRG